MLQAIVICSEKKFQFTEQGELTLLPKAFPRTCNLREDRMGMLRPLSHCTAWESNSLHSGDANEFMKFFLNTLHVALNGNAKTTSSILYRTFRGRMRQFTRKVLPVDATDEQRRTLLETGEFDG